jgi:hypothetical protein
MKQIVSSVSIRAQFQLHAFCWTTLCLDPAVWQQPPVSPCDRLLDADYTHLVSRSPQSAGWNVPYVINPLTLSSAACLTCLKYIRRACLKGENCKWRTRPCLGENKGKDKQQLLIIGSSMQLHGLRNIIFVSILILFFCIENAEEPVFN